jgi:diadenosine tetraphosphate (Ap4A) HIT family hydrolase
MDAKQLVNNYFMKLASIIIYFKKSCYVVQLLNIVINVYHNALMNQISHLHLHSTTCMTIYV